MPFAELVRRLTEPRSVVGERRVALIFDRSGWSTAAFKTITDTGFDPKVRSDLAGSSG